MTAWPPQAPQVVAVMRRFAEDDYMVKFADGMFMVVDQERYLLRSEAQVVGFAKGRYQAEMHNGMVSRFGAAWLENYERARANVMVQ